MQKTIHIQYTIDSPEKNPIRTIHGSFRGRTRPTPLTNNDPSVALHDFVGGIFFFFFWHGIVSESWISSARGFTTVRVSRLASKGCAIIYGVVGDKRWEILGRRSEIRDPDQGLLVESSEDGSEFDEFWWMQWDLMPFQCNWWPPKRPTYEDHQSTYSVCTSNQTKVQYAKQDILIKLIIVT